MSDEKTIKAVALKDFNDAGTEQRFAKGDTPTLPEGVFANYEAAGLVRKATAEDARAAKADTKSDA
ncbi:hypothetical protein [uncultured Novosphingobium sp.]|uniref:hypothetical protein n=1 Tax=uncultured Novosphingobium sp. TaxID=292277 RepID=UPI003749D39A